MFGPVPCRFMSYAHAAALIAGATASAAHAEVIFQSGFDSDTLGTRPTWSAGSDNNNAGDPTVKFRVTVAGDPFTTGTADQNKYLRARDTQNNAAGHLTMRGLANASSLATLTFDFVEPARDGAGSRLYVQVGQTTGTLGTDTDRGFQFSLNTGVWTTQATGSNTTASYTLDAKHTVAIVMNYSDAAINYAALGNGSEALASGRYDLYIDGVKALDDASRYLNGANPTLPLSTALSAFNFQSFTSDANQEVLIDNVVLQTGAVIPEPTALGLVGLGAGALSMRRR